MPAMLSRPEIRPLLINNFPHHASLAHPTSQSMQARLVVFIIALLSLFSTPQLHAYSVLTHEQIIDLAWQDSIVPLLLREYPGLTQQQLDEAHSYAYGGCAIQDLGYYPFGSGFFSDLTHYVRTGDFIRSLFRNQKNPDELAFAIGALSHYIGDTEGHADAVNPSVAIEFPALAAKYGPSVNYAQGRHQHIQTEFAFDVNQVSKRHFAPLEYLNHVGLHVPQQLIDKAFFDTYGISAHKLTGGHNPTMRVYRFGVRSFIPRIAYAEALLHRNVKRFPADLPTPAHDAYLAQLTTVAAAEDWNAYRKKHPGFKTRFIAILISITPRIGLARELSLRGPTPQTEQLYIESINRTTANLRRLLRQYDTIQARLTNRDLDTGDPVKPGRYSLSDTTYAHLLDAVTKDPTVIIPTELRNQLVAYYADPSAPILTKKNKRKWDRVQSQLIILATMKSRRDPPVPDIDLDEDIEDDTAN